MISKKDIIREQAEKSLESFIKLVHPQRVLGGVHQEIISWWTSSQAKSHQLLLLPRDHMKSALIAYRVAWEITRDPTIRVLYISSTARLAIKQIKFIKDILTSKTYKFYWPEMISDEESKREKWTESEFSVDHPKRKAEVIRDPTVFTAGLTSTIVGMHCDVAVLDDVVVFENAYTEEGRKKVKSQYSLLSSIESSEAREWTVGTRYHPKDLYADLMGMEVEYFNKGGDIVKTEPLYEKYERQVEDRGDGSGEFLWPKQQRVDGKWFGFDAEVLSKKKAQYLDKTQFRAQYYNDPQNLEDAVIKPECFQYYDPKFLSRKDGRWYFKGARLNVFAGIDFAFSLRQRADFTAVVVLGIDASMNYYVLEIERFKSDKISDYFDHILRMHQKWDFRKLRAETTAAQSVIVQDLKNNYIRTHGLSLSIDEYRPGKNEGTKEERVEALLQPRYTNLQMYHYRGGNCQVLEEELTQSRPAHDDCKDCLAAVVDVATAPSLGYSNMSIASSEKPTFYHSKFGGIL